MISSEKVQQIALQHYGIQCSIEALAGELDLNYLVTDCEGRYVLKIHHSLADPNVLDFQNQAMLWLSSHAPHLPFPRVLPTTQGNREVLIQLDGEQRRVRLLSWVPGNLWSTEQQRTSQQFYALGEFLAEMDITLRTFSHFAADRDFLWDMKKASQHREMASTIENTEIRGQVKVILNRFEDCLLPALNELPSQVIHNDANDNNILLDQDGAIFGLIDFGDMIIGHRVTEIAVAAAYLMCNQADPVAAILPLVSGYHSVDPLTPVEAELIFDLALTRVAISICMANRQFAKDPDNQYLLISQAPFHDLLRKIRSENKQLIRFRLRDACGYHPCPNAYKVVRWLHSHRGQFGAVCNYDLTNSNNLRLLDLSIDGEHANDLRQLTSAKKFTRFIFNKMKSVNASVGVGRYLEKRGIYQSEVFETMNPAERRDRHLGIDLFMNAEEPLYAPLSGTVEGIANNSDAYDYGPIVILRHEPQPGLIFWTKYGHLSLQTLDHLVVGQSIERGEIIGWIGNYPHNGNWPPHTHIQILTTLLGMGTGIHGVGNASSISTWQSVCPNPNLILNMPIDCQAESSREPDELLEKRKQRMGRMLSLSYKQPLKIDKGSMQYLYDNTGTKYLDMVNNVCHVGHCHPRVVAAGQKQMAELNTNTRYLHDNIAHLSERLCALLPDPLSVCFFVNSGSEANDLALRLARCHTGHNDMLVLEQSYHGNLGSLIDVSPYKFDGKGGSGCPQNTWMCSLPDIYRGEFREDNDKAAEMYAASAKQQLLLLQQSGRRLAGFIAESLGGVSGQQVFPEGYLAAVYEQARAAGGVCIADEVQVGLGRMGRCYWGFETQNVVPDIVTIGKPLGNGHPVAAVVTTAAIARSFHNGMEYFNTFGGNPVSMAIATAVLDTIGIDRLVENAFNRGEQLQSGLRNLSNQHHLIGNVRGIGLFVGAELVRDQQTLEPATNETGLLIEYCKRHGILLSSDGKYSNTLKIKPPMCISADDIDSFLNVLNEGFLHLEQEQHYD
ncbi:MAG: 4-aminobutyrate aminotransferase-like enzyme/Ser/Thr protein kinase RdoA (MazF antagonist) [Parasphingorhabdus sp.]|jgi:4-aminobutyrate aminotransferase-like enzyme/Ser/Thr protein kinase RdoA (MazF antagonist)